MLEKRSAHTVRMLPAEIGLPAMLVQSTYRGLINYNLECRVPALIFSLAYICARPQRASMHCSICHITVCTSAKVINAVEPRLISAIQ